MKKKTFVKSPKCQTKAKGRGGSTPRDKLPSTPGSERGNGSKQKYQRVLTLSRHFFGGHVSVNSNSSIANLWNGGTVYRSSLPLSCSCWSAPYLRRRLKQPYGHLLTSAWPLHHAQNNQIQDEIKQAAALDHDTQ